MAIVTTDNKHYTNIADAIRTDANVSTRYAPEEMPGGVHQVYAKGKSDGYTEGETAGKAAGRAEVEAENAAVLEDINTALTGKGAEAADSLGDVPEKIESIEAGGGDDFWDVYQQNGARTDYLYGFAAWPVASIKPKYDVIVTSGNSMFTNTGNIDKTDVSLPDIAAECGITFDFSKNTSFTNFMSWGRIVDLGFVDTTGCANIGSGFSYCSYLKRLSLAIKEDGSQEYSGAFVEATGLEDLSIVSGYFGSNLNFAQSSKLSPVSRRNIIDHLKDLTGAMARTITFHATVYDALTEDEKATISGKNWTAARA